MIVTSNNLLFQTKILSFSIQILFAIIGIYALFQYVPIENYAVKQSLSIEMFVQLIQMSMYIYLIFKFHVPSMALSRYIDWFLTTPLMLFSLMLYFKYEKNFII